MKLTFADFEIDTNALTLTRASQAVAVEPQVFDLIVLLARNADRVVTKDEIIEAVWGGRIVSESAISARVAAARKAVGDDGARQAVIRTVARRGLQMVSAVGSADDPRPPAVARHDAPTGPRRIRYTRNDRGQSLAYSVHGSGPPLVNVCHNTSHLGLEWDTPFERDLLDRLARDFTLVCSDAVGTGLSELAVDRIDFAQAADDLIRVADAAGIERFAVSSQSGACLTALHLAARHPDRVTRLAMTGAYARGRSMRGTGDTDLLRQMIADGWDEAASSQAATVMFSYFPEGPLEAVQAIGDIARQATPQANALMIRDAINNVDMTPILPQILCPVLLVHARHDRVHPLAEAQRLAAGLADCELVVLETANHCPLPGNPIWPGYMDMICDFLRTGVTEG